MGFNRDVIRRRLGRRRPEPKPTGLAALRGLLRR
jgi:hypothetical protein